MSAACAFLASQSDRQIAILSSSIFDNFENVALLLLAADRMDDPADRVGVHALLADDLADVFGGDLQLDDAGVAALDKSLLQVHRRSIPWPSHLLEDPRRPLRQVWHQPW